MYNISHIYKINNFLKWFRTDLLFTVDITYRKEEEITALLVIQKLVKDSIIHVHVYTK
jgi:hypothetical protein